MTRKRMVGPGGGDFAPSLTTVGGRMGGGGKSIVTGKKSTVSKKAKEEKEHAEKGGATGIKNTVETTKKPGQKFRGTIEAAHGIKHIKNFKTKEAANDWVDKVRRHTLAGVRSTGRVTKLP